MAEDRLESVISQTMDDSVIAKVMVKRFEKAYPELETDSALRDKCADFIDHRRFKGISFSRIAFLAKFAQAATEHQEAENKQQEQNKKDEYLDFLESMGLENTPENKAMFAEYQQAKAQEQQSAQSVAVPAQEKDPYISFLQDMGLQDTPENKAMFAELQAAKAQEQQSQPLFVGMTQPVEEKAYEPHEPTEIERSYLDLNKVIDETFPLIEGYAEMQDASERLLNIRLNAPNADSNLIMDGQKDTMYAYERLYEYADNLIYNEQLEANQIKPEEKDKMTSSEHAEKAEFLVDRLLRTSSEDRIQTILSEIDKRSNIAKDAMFEFGEVAATRELAGNPKAAALCTTYPELTMVALVQNNGRPIDSVEKFEAIMDNPKNVNLASQYMFETFGKKSEHSDTYEKIKNFVFQKTQEERNYRANGGR